MGELCLAAVMPFSLYPLSLLGRECGNKVGSEDKAVQNSTPLHSGSLGGRGMGNMSLKHSIFLGKGRG